MAKSAFRQWRPIFAERSWAISSDLEPMEVERVDRSRTELWVAVLNEKTAEVEIRAPRSEGIGLQQMLKASVAMPVLYGRAIPLPGRRYIDAGFVQPFPLSAAIAAGCTDLLVLTARPTGYRAAPPTWLQRQLFNLRCGNRNVRLRSVYRLSAETQNRQRGLADGTLPCNVNIATLAPTNLRVTAMTTDATLLRDETNRMCRRVLELFGASVDQLEKLTGNGTV